MRPSAPQTGSKMVEEQLQSALQEASSTSLVSLIKLHVVTLSVLACQTETIANNR